MISLEECIPSFVTLGSKAGFYPITHQNQDTGLPEERLWIPSWLQDYESLVLAGLVAKVRNGEPNGRPKIDRILSIARGGARVGGDVGYALDVAGHSGIQLYGYDDHDQPLEMPIITSAPDPAKLPHGEHILVVDDLRDRGKALAVVCDWADENLHPLSIETAVPWVKDKEDPGEVVAEADYQVRHIPDLWVEFESQMTAEQRAARLAQLKPVWSEMERSAGWLARQLPCELLLSRLIAISGPDETGILEPLHQ